MLAFLVHVIIVLLVVALLCFIVRQIPDAYVPAAIKNIVFGVIVVVVVIWLLLSIVPLLGGGHSLTL